MNTQLENSWGRIGQSYKIAPQEKSWDSIKMRLENKKLKNRMIVYKKLSVAAFFIGIMGIVTVFYVKNTTSQSPTLALKASDTFEFENWSPSEEVNIYNMSELKGLKNIYEANGQNTNL